MKSKIFELWFPWTPDTVGFEESEIDKIHNRPLAQVIGKVCGDLGWYGRQIYFTNRKKTYSSVHDNVENVLFPVSLRGLKRSHSFGQQISAKALIHLATAPLGCVAFFQAHGQFPVWGARICEARKIPYLVIIGGWYVGSNKLLTRYYGHSYRLLAHTQMQLDALIQAGHSHQNMMLFPIGVDMQVFTPKPDGYYAVREEWPRLLYVGRMYGHKGVLQAFQAFSAIIRDFPGAKLKIIGSRGDSDTTANLDRLIKEHHLTESVTIYSPVDHHELVGYYQEADLFLYPSVYEGLPQVVLESMACGTPPVVIRSSGGTEEAVIHDEVGWVVDMPNLAYELVAILSDPQKIKAVGINASKRVKEVYPFERTYNILLGILNSIQS